MPEEPKKKPARVIVELGEEHFAMIEEERKAVPGKVPSRAQVIRELIEEASAARKLARGAK